MHVPVHDIPLDAHPGVAAGAYGLGHDNAPRGCGMRVPASCSSGDTADQVCQNRLELTGVIVLLCDIACDDPIGTGL